MRCALLLWCGLALAQLSPEAEYEQARQRLLADGDIRAALRRYQTIAANQSAPRSVRAKAQLEAARCFEKLGDASAKEAYRRILSDFSSESAIAAQARQRLSALDNSSRPVVQRIAESESIGAFISVSRDGGRIAFASFDNQLALFDTAARTVRYLTPRSAESVRSSVFSPDGFQIAYGLGENPDSRSLHVVSLKDGKSRKLLSANTRRFLGAADWFGDSLLVAFEDRDRKTAQLEAIDPTSGKSRILRSVSGAVPLPAKYSPDGRFITFNLGSDIHVMPAVGGDSWPAGSGQLAGWAGRFLVFISDRRGSRDLWAQPVHEGRPSGASILLHRDLQSTIGFGLSRDGTFYHVVAAPVSEVMLGEMDPSSGTLRGQSAPADPAAAGITSFADWSPDGERIAFWSTPAGGKPVLKIRSERAGAMREVPVELRQPGQIRWFPDGESILTEAFDQAHGERFYKVSLANGAVEVAIPDDLSRDASKNPAWLVPGRTLLFRARLGGFRTPGRGRIYSWDFATSRLEELAGPSEFGSWALSPSKRRLAFLIHENPADVLRIAPPGSSETQLIFRTPPGQSLKKSGAIAWTLDENAVIAAMGLTSNPRVHELWRFPVDGGAPARILTAGVLKDLRIHPDGRRFSYTSLGAHQEIWVMKNLIPAGR